MALGPGDVYSLQAPGLATVLPGGLAPLRVYQQEAYRIQREHLAAARARQQQEAADARSIVPLAANGWLPHADELGAAVQKGYQDMKAVYADPAKTPFEKRQYGLQKQAELKALEDRSNELKTQYKEAVALGADKRYNKQALEQGLYNMNFRPGEDGRPQAIPLAEMDGGTYASAASNPDYYNSTEVVNKFLDELGTKEQKEYTEAARVGQAGHTRAGASNIFAYDDKGQPLWTTNGEGQRVRQIANLNLLEQAALRDPFMAGLLRKQAQAGQQPSAAQLMGLPPEQVSDADLEALNAQTDTRTPHSRQLLADLVRSYGTVSERNRELSPKAAPRASAAGQSKVVVNANANGVPGGVVPIADNGQGIGYSSSYVFQAPTKTKVSTGQTEGYGFDGAQHSTYIRRVPGKDDEVVTNSREPQNVQYDGGFLALTTPSGKIVRPPGGQELHGQALLDFWREQREKNPKLTIEPVVNGSPRKGKNELGDREAIADQLQRSYAQTRLLNPGQRELSRAELLKKADDIVGKQNASYQYIYSDTHPLSEKRRIDSYAPGAFNSREKQAELQRALREADEATKPRAHSQAPRPSFLKTKTATKPATTARPTVDRAGGML